MSARPALRVIEHGYCHCGCGEKTNTVDRTRKSGGVTKGEPRKYINGHQSRAVGPEYVVEDSGYDTPCWIWQGATTGGYGVLRAAGRVSRAHIVVYERARGAVPDGKQLDHLCRVRACVNPAHLEPVTQVENIRRGARTRLSEEQVREVRRSLSRGVSHATVASLFGVSKSTVSAIATGRSWKDVA